MLGSVRAVTNADGAVLECYDYLPFGRMLGSSDNQRSSCHPTSPDTSLDSETAQKFTGQVRDEETRLDYFGARYYSAAQGRFMSADPVAMSAGRLSDPQAINLYAYVRNNPLKYIDPLGEDLSFAGLSEEDNERLLEILEERSGLALNYIPDTGLVGIAGTGSGGSELFRDGLTRLIGSDQVFTVSNQSSYQGQRLDFGRYDPETQNIILDFNDAASVPEIDLGLVFYHEGISHGLKGLLDEPRSRGDLTTILDTIDAARELGLHAPTGHAVMPDGRGRYFIRLLRPFREPDTGLNRIQNWLGSGSTSIDLTDVYSNSN